MTASTMAQSCSCCELVRHAHAPHRKIYAHLFRARLGLCNLRHRILQQHPYKSTACTKLIGRTLKAPRVNIGRDSSKYPYVPARALPARHTTVSSWLEASRAAVLTCLCYCGLLGAPRDCQALQVDRLQPVAEVAGLARGSPDQDPTDPFTLYGQSSKKYVIEKLSGEKIVNRRPGITAQTCISAMPASEETPAFQRLSAGQKAVSTGGETCKKVEGKDVKAACGGSCIGACSAAFDKYAAERKVLTGFEVAAEADKERLLRACSRQCTYQCGKPGNGYGFAVPFRQ